MKEVGGLLIVVGIITIVVALNMDVSIPTYDTSGLLPRSMVNLHALQQQAMTFYGGVGAFIAGVVALGLGRIEETIRSQTGERVDASNSMGAPSYQSVQSSADASDSAPDGMDLSSWIVIGGVLMGAILLIVLMSWNSTSDLSSAGTTNEIVQNTLDEANQAVADLENAANAAIEDLDAATRNLN